MPSAMPYAPRSPGVPTITAPRSPQVKTNASGVSAGRHKATEKQLPSLASRAEFQNEGITREELRTLCQRFYITPGNTAKALEHYDNHDGSFNYDDFVKKIGPIIVPNVGVATSFHVEADFGPRWDTTTSNFIEDAKHRVPLGAVRGNPPPQQPIGLQNPWLRKAHIDQIKPWLADTNGHHPKGGTWPGPDEKWSPGTHTVKSLGTSSRPETADGPLEARCPTLARYNFTMASPARRQVNSAPGSARVHVEGHRARTVPHSHPDRERLAQVPCVEKGAAWFQDKDIPLAEPVRWKGLDTDKPGMYLYETNDNHNHFIAHCARQTPNFRQHLAKDRHMQKPLRNKVEGRSDSK